MSIYIGGSQIEGLYVGDKPADEVYLGTELVWRRVHEPVVYEYATAGAYVVDVPEWATHYELLTVGGGQGGESGRFSSTVGRTGHVGQYRASFQLALVNDPLPDTSPAVPIPPAWKEKPNGERLWAFVGAGGAGGSGSSTVVNHPGGDGQPTLLFLSAGEYTEPEYGWYTSLAGVQEAAGGGPGYDGRPTDGLSRVISARRTVLSDGAQMAFLGGFKDSLPGMNAGMGGAGGTGSSQNGGRSGDGYIWIRFLQQEK